MTVASPSSQAGSGNVLVDVAIDYWQGLKSLFSCPREIWIAYLVKVLESICYFSAVLVLMIFLTEDMGLSDLAAGTIFGVWSAAMSLCMLFVGFIADSWGIKKALLVGLVVAMAGRVAITFTTNPWVVYPGLLFLAVGFAYMIPLVAAAVKHFSTRRAQKYAFAWYYVVMNVGAALAGLLLDPIRAAVSEPMQVDVAGMGLVIRPTQVIFFVSVVATLLSMLLIFFFVRTEIPASAFDETEEAPEQAAAASGERRTAFRIMREVGADKLFWIFIVFMFLLVMVKMIFQYNHSLYPLYMDRIGFGDWTGKLYSINPVIIIFLVPVMTSITAKMNAYRVIMIGSFVSAGSVLFMGFGESIAMIIAFQVVLSFGEALWSPRLYDYTANVAPPGKVASYMALSKVPMFFAKVGAGPASGALLAALCPLEGARNTELMWIIVGCSTLLSPLTLWLGRRWLDVESRRQEEAARVAAQAAST